MKPELRQQLNLNQAYWIAQLSEEDLKSEGSLVYKDLKTARKYDVFGTANFFNFVPFKAAIDYFLKIGLNKVKAHNDTLIDQWIEGINNLPFDFISPREGRLRSSLVVFSHKNPDKNPAIFKQLLSKGIYPAFWKGNIRISPHVYNTSKEIERVLKALD